MIRELRLQNFQKHRSRKIVFEPGLNLVVGPTDGGKSAVFRALKWVALHGSATGLMTHGETSMKVGVLGELAPVIRFRDSKKNGYKINDQTLVAVGQNQPEEVRQILGLSEINFQAQHDPPFLLGMTPGQIAKEINKIVDLEAIDQILSKVKSKATGAKALVANLEPKAQEAKAAEEALAWVPGAAKAWMAVEVMESKHREAVNAARLLAAELRELGEVDAYLDKTEIFFFKAEAAWHDWAGISDGLTASQTAQNALGRILGDLDAVRHLDDQIACMEALQRLVDLWQVVDTARAAQDGLHYVLGVLGAVDRESKDVVAVGKALSSVEKLGQESRQVDVGRCTLQSLLEDLAYCEVEIKKLGGDIQELERKAKLCPTCGKPL